jgi:hypothetical protein
MTEIEEFYYDFRQDVFAGSEARQDYLEAEFVLSLTKELEDSGAIEGFEPCHYKAPRGMRVDGYWFKEEGAALDLFISDFENRESLESLTRSDVISIFKRLENFFINSIEKHLYNELEETSPGYGLSRDICDRQNNFSKVNLYLISERNLSERIQALDEIKHKRWTLSYHVWDIARFQRLQTSRGAKEDLVVDFVELYGEGLPCLPAHLNAADYESYLLVLPGEILSDLYGKYGARLLEQNVRCFLQARGTVNKGIRATIMNDPGMFFAYNNGITATAKEVIVEQSSKGNCIRQIRDLQIVNGGQTTASLFHTNRKDKASLDQVFVQMKLSVVDEEKSEEVVPKISEYANTQNKVNAADFFSNHPFHIRMEEFSRRVWAPAQQGSLRDTKWFYERARGQYVDAQTKLSQAGKKKMQMEYPKSQMFTKTELAKFENVWDEKPSYVNLGSQKNFAKYAERIGKEWEKNPNRFNESYYKYLIARAILFKRTEKLVSAQSWYQGGYRANIVAYTLALISEYCKAQNKSMDLIQIWKKQSLSSAAVTTIEIVAKVVSDSISQPQAGISNISEWCKKDACWDKLKKNLPDLKRIIPVEFNAELTSIDVIKEEIKDSSKTQIIDNGIQAQARVLEFTGEQWLYVMKTAMEKGIALSPKEIGILEVATRIPNKIPSSKQSEILLTILEKATLEGITLP